MHSRLEPREGSPRPPLWARAKAQATGRPVHFDLQHEEREFQSAEGGDLSDASGEDAEPADGLARWMRNFDYDQVLEQRAQGQGHGAATSQSGAFRDRSASQYLPEQPRDAAGQSARGDASLPAGANREKAFL